MRKSTCFSTHLAFILATCVGLSLVMSAPAYAGIVVSKAVTGIDANDDPDFEITDGGEIAAFLADVPNTTVIAFEMMITVGATNGQNLTDVVVTDRFGGELFVECVDHVGDCTLTTKGASNKVFLTWEVGPLADGESETLTLIATTDMNPGGQQEYTSCGDHDLNSGPTAKAKVDRSLPPNSRAPNKRQVSDDGNSVTLTVSGTAATVFPQCSNCLDDDGDGMIDLLDDACSDPLDDDESDESIF